MLDLALWGVGTVLPALMGVRWVLLPALFVTAIVVPVFLMEQLARSPIRRIYRYILG